MGDGLKESTIETRRVFDGRLIAVESVDVELPDGRRSVREIVRHRGAVAVLAECADGRMVLVRQFRKALDQVTLEIVAGTLEPGESPSVCARRELREETGYEASELLPLGIIYPAPGYTDEAIHVFFARLCDDPGASDPDDDENVEVCVMDRAELEAMISEGAVRDAKTLAAWLLYEKRVRGEAALQSGGS